MALQSRFRLFLGLLTGFLITSTASSQTPPEKNMGKKERPVMVGGDRDSHGCKGSAGYTWSRLGKRCIRTFEDGTRLNPHETEEGAAVISAFILFNKQRTKVEVFIAGKPSTILSKKESGTGAVFWINGKFKLSQSPETGEYLLSKSEKLIYSGAPANE